ncbi:hypothetical protein [Neisseria flavescens]|nr:hypothetical protein [Neisseria flavescens]
MEQTPRAFFQTAFNMYRKARTRWVKVQGKWRTRAYRTHLHTS